MLTPADTRFEPSPIVTVHDPAATGATVKFAEGPEADAGVTLATPLHESDSVNLPAKPRSLAVSVCAPAESEVNEMLDGVTPSAADVGVAAGVGVLPGVGVGVAAALGVAVASGADGAPPPHAASVRIAQIAQICLFTVGSIACRRPKRVRRFARCGRVSDAQ